MSSVDLTAAMIVEATGGRLVRPAEDRVFDGVSIDSRTLRPGALFVALRGERFDGHAFVDEAVRRGAAGVLVSQPPPELPGTVVILVEDTLVALQALGRAVRRASGATVVAITGSAGKTTTKEAIGDLLATRYRVLRSQGNLNNHIGLPVSLVELRHGPDVAVVELGMNHAGEMRLLAQMAEPDVRVWTNVGDAHVGAFGSREALARAKAEILEGVTNENIVVANADDPLVMAHVEGGPGRLITFGEAAGADVRALAVVDRGFDGTSAEVISAAGRIQLSVALPGRVQLSNVLAAIGVALQFDVPIELIEIAARALKPVARRGATTILADGTRLVDDSYNASPAATRAMLAAMAATAGPGRRVAVLGEMLELGEAAAALHEDCGRAAADAGVDELVAIGGPAADGLVRGARAGGLAAERIHRFPDSVTAAPAVAALIAPGDLVLVKGSRGVRTDIVADRLREAA